MTLRNFISAKLAAAGNPTHEHRLSFERGQQTTVLCSNANAITVDHNVWMNCSGSMILNGNATIGGAGGGMRVNGDIAFNDYPPTPNCGRVIGVQYIGNTGGVNLNEIQQMLDAVQQIQYQNGYINSYYQQASTYNQQAAKYNSDLNSINARNADMQKKIADIGSNISAGGIDKLINTYSPAQLAHVLSKIWLKSDSLSNNLKQLITAKSFDANHYTPSSDSSLLKIAIDQKDITLFKLLVKNGLNFNAQFSTGELIFTEIINTQNQALISDMLNPDNNLNIKKAMFSAVSRGNKCQIDISLNIKPELAALEHYGLTLLQHAIREHQYEISEQIIQTNDAAKSAVNSEGTSVLEFALNLADEKALEILKNSNVLFTPAVQKCVNNNEITKIKLLLKYAPTLDFRTIVNQEGNSILHLATKAQDMELIKTCLDLYPNMLNTAINNHNQTALQYAYVQNIEDMTVLELLMDSPEAIVNQDINDINLVGLGIGGGVDVDNL